MSAQPVLGPGDPAVGAKGRTLDVGEFFDCVGSADISLPVWVFDGFHLRAVEDLEVDDERHPYGAVLVGFDADGRLAGHPGRTVDDVLDTIGDLDNDTPLIGAGFINDGGIREGVFISTAQLHDDRLVLHVAPPQYWPAPTYYTDVPHLDDAVTQVANERGHGVQIVTVRPAGPMRGVL